MRWTAQIIVFLVAAAMCLIGHIAILASVVRRRSAVVDSNVPRPRTTVEIVWALIPAIALTFLLTSTWERIRENRASSPPEVVNVAQ